MLGFIAGLFVGTKVVRPVGDAANRAARRVANGANDLARLIQDTKEGGDMLVQRMRQNGMNPCALGHTSPWRDGGVGDDNTQYMRCHDCGASWTQQYVEDR